MWESRPLLARFPRGSWEVWETCFWFSTLSTAPPFPQLSSLWIWRDGQLLHAPFIPLHLAFCLLFLLGLLHPIARNVQFNNHAMVH
jgi:hypothetical protein